jgi:hypothetical protein
MFGLFCSVQFNSIQFLNNQEGIVPQMRRPGLNVSTTPLRQWGFRQCLPFSWTTLRGKHCRHHIAVMEVVDTFGLCLNPHFIFDSHMPALSHTFYEIEMKPNQNRKLLAHG